MNQSINTTSSLASRWASLPEEEHSRLISCFSSAEDRASGRRDARRDDLISEVEEMIYLKNSPAVIARDIGLPLELVQAYVDASNALLEAKIAASAADEVELKGF